MRCSGASGPDWTAFSTRRCSSSRSSRTSWWLGWSSSWATSSVSVRNCPPAWSWSSASVSSVMRRLSGDICSAREGGTMSDTTDQHDVPGRAKVSTRAATPTRPKKAPSPDEVETCEEQSEGRSAEPNAVGARQATAAGAALEPAEQPRPAVEAVENGLAEDRAGTRAEHDAPSDGSPEDASKDVATDDVATDEVATDEVATDDVVDTGEGGDDEPTVLDGRSGSDPDDAPRNAVGNGDERGAGDGTDPDSAPRDLAGRGAEQAEGSRTLAESPAESPAAADGAGREAAAQVGAGPVAAGPVAAENDTTEGAAVEGAAAGPADAGTPVTEGAEAGTAAVEGAAAGTADAGTPVTEGAEAEGAEAEGAEAEGAEAEGAEVEGAEAVGAVAEGAEAVGGLV